jgi:hypothetical protein
MNDDSLSNQEIADYIMDLLEEFSPAISVEDGEEGWQVKVSMTMARTRIAIPPTPIRGHGPDPFNE